MQIGRKCEVVSARRPDGSLSHYEVRFVLADEIVTIQLDKPSMRDLAEAMLRAIAGD